MASLAELVYSKKLCTELECCYCKEMFKEPVTLSCWHTYCRKCLHDAYIDGLPQYHPKPEWHPFRCVVCGQTHFTNLSVIETLPVNKALRNILEGFPGILDRCKTHDRALVIFCKDCDDGKCLLCFMKNCQPKEHVPEDLYEVEQNSKAAMEDKLNVLTELTGDLKMHENLTKKELITKLRNLLPHPVSHELLAKLDSTIFKMLHRDLQVNLNF